MIHLDIFQASRKEIDFWIPLEVPSQNVTDRQHWAVKKKFSEICRYWIRYAMPEQNKATGRRSMTITAYRRRLITDDANLRGGAKGIVDAIVKSGLLIDDNDKMVEIHYDQHLASQSPSKKPCTRIQISCTGK